jgi:hypothetical protein
VQWKDCIEEGVSLEKMYYGQQRRRNYIGEYKA